MTQLSLFLSLLSISWEVDWVLRGHTNTTKSPRYCGDQRFWAIKRSLTLIWEMRWLSVSGIWELRTDHVTSTSHELTIHKCEFRVVATTESTTGETGPLKGSCWKSSRSSSATGFLFWFFTLLITRTIVWLWETESLSGVMKQGSVSVHSTARGPSNGWMPMHTFISVLRGVS